MIFVRINWCESEIKLHFQTNAFENNCSKPTICSGSSLLTHWGRVKHICISKLSPLQWRHNGCDGSTNHRRLHWLINRLFKRRSKENIKAPRHWIPRTNGQLREKCFHLMTSSWSLVQIMAYHLLGAKPSSESIMAECQWDPKEHILLTQPASALQWRHNYITMTS